MIIKSLGINGMTKVGNTYQIKEQRAVCYMPVVLHFYFHIS